MAEVVLDESVIEAGESYFAVYVDCSRGGRHSIIADLKMNLTGPVTPEVAQPRKLSGFELPALELMRKAQERATELGVQRILLIDPQGLMSLARIDRYDRG